MAGDTYEGYEFEVRPILDVVFNYECCAIKEGKPTLTGHGWTEEGAVEHVKILINREVSNLGS